MAWLAAILGVFVGAIVTALVLRDRRGETTDTGPSPSGGASSELDRLRAALDALPAGILVADGDGRFVVRNALVDHFAGSWQGDVLVSEAAQLLLDDALAGRRVDRTLDLFGPPRRVVHVRALPIGDGASGGVVVIDDITERTRIDAVRTDFVTNISHELKTPVGALTLLAETLADADDPADVRRLSDKVVAEADRLSRTIDDLLELSRIELSGDAVRDAIHVRSLIDDAIARVAALAERHGIGLVVSPGLDDDLSLLGDRRQLLSALGNLVENAVKYSEPGGLVEVGAEAHDGGEVELVVADHGVGIPAADVDRIFERFYRVDRARSRETGGTGLGLSIVRHVATNHGGRVSVVSTEGEGSVFRLTIPRQPATQPREEATS